MVFFFASFLAVSAVIVASHTHSKLWKINTRQNNTKRNGFLFSKSNVSWSGLVSLCVLDHPDPPPFIVICKIERTSTITTRRRRSKASRSERRRRKRIICNSSPEGLTVFRLGEKLPMTFNYTHQSPPSAALLSLSLALTEKTWRPPAASDDCSCCLRNSLAFVRFLLLLFFLLCCSV